ncbi:MAG: DUF2155 domain-containing protein [Alphaproteobacteria bacterium]|nr:DUF2155 domain-containing protein [Alphaproteobacteria bacterium]
MKKIILSWLLCALPVVADAYVNRNVAVVKIMNKDAGKVQQVTIPVNQELQFEKIFINVRSCKQTDPFQPEDFFAFFEISERDKGRVFGGWMSRNEPGQNPLQHPDYDVWLVKCE